MDRRFVKVQRRGTVSERSLMNPFPLNSARVRILCCLSNVIVGQSCRDSEIRGPEITPQTPPKNDDFLMFVANIEKQGLERYLSIIGE